MHTQRHNDTRLTVLQIPGHFCAKRCANAPLKRQPLSQMWPIAGEKKIKKTRSTQAATKSAKSGFIQTHQKESFLFRRWQETRHEVYILRPPPRVPSQEADQSERTLPSVAGKRNASRGLPRPPSRVPSQEADQSARTPSSVAAWQGALPPIVARSSPLLTL